MNPKYTVNGIEVEYEPRYNIGRLEWFNLAVCARKRMIDHSHDVLRWRGERRTFYTYLRTTSEGVVLMDVD